MIGVLMQVYQIAFWGIVGLMVWAGSAIVLQGVIDDIIKREAVAQWITLVLSIAVAIGVTWLVIQMQYSGNDYGDRPSYGVGPYETR